MIVVLYSKNTGRIREYATDPDRKTEADWASYLQGKLNANIDVLYTENADLYTLQARVTQATGKDPTGDRYAIVKGAKVKGWIGNADPACGDFDGPSREHGNPQFIKNAEADERWGYNPATGEFTRPVEATKNGNPSIPSLPNRV